METVLHNPNYIELDDVYRGLNKFEGVVIKSPNYKQHIHFIERIGFVGLRIELKSKEDNSALIQAYKGKHGPCHFSGWVARYTGGAIAALDDDNHILFFGRDTEICEKTANIYKLTSYKEVVKCHEFNTEHNTGNKNEPVQGSGDFETDQSVLFGMLEKGNPEDPVKPLFYPGPFRILFLKDGTMVRRGNYCIVPEEEAEELIIEDGCLLLEPKQKINRIFFQDEYLAHGPACLLDDYKPENIKASTIETDFSKLSSLTPKLRERLIKVIKESKQYIILIGNEVDELMGCCPSEEVTEANFLVKCGILTSLSEPFTGDTCPVTIYAFKNEILKDADGPKFTIHEPFREKVLSYLENVRQPVWKRVIKWILLIFIFISLIVIFNKWLSLNKASDTVPISEILSPSSDNEIQVILFHNEKRCFQCLRLEQYTVDILEKNNKTLLTEHGIIFKTIIIDYHENRSLVQHFGIYGPTIVLTKYEDGALVKSKIPEGLSGFYRNEEMFKENLKTELEIFME